MSDQLDAPLTTTIEVGDLRVETCQMSEQYLDRCGMLVAQAIVTKKRYVQNSTNRMLYTELVESTAFCYVCDLPLEEVTYVWNRYGPSYIEHGHVKHVLT